MIPLTTLGGREGALEGTASDQRLHHCSNLPEHALTDFHCSEALFRGQISRKL